MLIGSFEAALSTSMLLECAPALAFWLFSFSFYLKRGRKEEWTKVDEKLQRRTFRPRVNPWCVVVAAPVCACVHLACACLLFLCRVGVSVPIQQHQQPALVVTRFVQQKNALRNICLSGDNKVSVLVARIIWLNCHDIQTSC